MKGTPVIINNRDRLTSLKTLVDWLRASDHCNITVIDNDSTYQPLLDYYASEPELKVRYLGRNAGPRALWQKDAIDLIGREPFVYTDSDIIPDADCPSDAIEQFIDVARTLCGRFKVGFGLRIDDIPDSYVAADRVRLWEAQYWQRQSTRPSPMPLYIAKIDTSFAVYLRGTQFVPDGLRTGGAYVARHAQWYVDSANPTEEELYVEQRSDRSLVRWGIADCFSESVKSYDGTSVQKKKRFALTQLPSHRDMAPYAPWYQGVVKNALESIGAPVVVEAGVRYGCSARIFADALQDYPSWRLHLIDPVITKQARDLTTDYPANITFYRSPGAQAARKIADDSVDILHIDADVDGTHPYEMALEILLAFWWKLKQDSTVILHDCTSHFPGIQRLANELIASGKWVAEYAEPQSECTISAPCALRRVSGEEGISDAGLPFFSVVVPVIKKRWLPGLLENIRSNIVKPTEILIIDNSGTEIAKQIVDDFSDLSIRYLPQSINLGVNASWNLGIAESQNEIVSVLNDDLILPDHFFESIMSVFAEMPRAGIVVPRTIFSKNDVAVNGTIPTIRHLDQREGWAFTLRKAAFTFIPSDFFTFCGDDFIYRTCHDNGYWTVKNLNSCVYHYVGISKNVSERKKLKLPPFERERTLWLEMLNQRKKGNCSFADAIDDTVDGTAIDPTTDLEASA